MLLIAIGFAGGVAFTLLSVIGLVCLVSGTTEETHSDKTDQLAL